MKIFFHRFFLKPKVFLNRLGSLELREGVFLKSLSKDGVGFSEYFPHPEWGDLSVDEFLKTFHLQQEKVQQKAFHFLNPHFLRKESKVFLNHFFYQGQNELNFKVIKYKIKHEDDLSFLSILENCEKLRLDANGLFNQQSWKTFLSRIPQDLLNRIEYIEDPLFDKDWSEVKIPKGRDFISGSPFQFSIYKPYRDFIDAQQNKIIFSGNMGHGLLNYQSYLELVEFGDLTLYHGLVTPNLYDNVPELFEQNAAGSFQPNLINVENYLKKFDEYSWDFLCMI